MNKLLWNANKCYYYAYQFFMRFIIKSMSYPKQQTIAHSNAIMEIPNILKERKANNICLICSKSVEKHGLIEQLLTELSNQKIEYHIFRDIHPNPTTDNVNCGYEFYQQHNCECIVAIGGGSVLDCAKIIGIKVTNPNLSFEQMKHMSKIKKALPFFVAVPTTSGTGSESTVAAVITDPKKHEKYPIISLHTMPNYAILDENLTLGLPKEFTAYTGMDALTHAIEAYIGTFGTRYTNQEALEAIKLIFDNLELAYQDGQNKEARRNMLIASNHAGNAFTRAYTGYVHTISHALSALYDVGHGKTNATILPYVLRYYGISITDKLAKIALYAELGNKTESKTVLAEKVIHRIEQLNESMNIPSKVFELKEKDIHIVIEKALKEGNPAYPVPKIMNYDDCLSVLNQLIV